MAKLKTLVPQVLNMRRDLPPPIIPFVKQYSDQAGKISKLVKDFYGDTKYLCGYFIRYNLVIAFKRNKNPKDYLVHAKL